MKKKETKGARAKGSGKGKNPDSKPGNNKKHSVVVVESPSKARTLAKFLQNHFLVKSSYGHVRDLPKSSLGVDVKNGFLLTYEVIKEKQKYLHDLGKAVKNAHSVYLATDPDREGEAIAWHIAELLSLRNPWRIAFHEITKDAVLQALDSPMTLNLDLVNAQQARRVLDRLVGYKISPLLWRRVRGGGKLLSAGRVQSVAVRLIVEREKEIKEHVPKEYWTVDAHLHKRDNDAVFKAALIEKDGEKIEINNEHAAQTCVRELEGELFCAAKVTQKPVKRNPMPPFTTSTMQQESFKRFGFSASKTMRVAQTLYEGVEIGSEGPAGLITYMRTDSVRVSPVSQSEARNVIASRFGNDFMPEAPPVYRSKKLAQEAHEAIRPTSLQRTPDSISGNLTREQALLYEAIYNRFLASQMRAAEYLSTSIDITAGKYLFRATGRKLMFPGFLKVYEEENQDTETENIIPPLSEGENLVLHHLLPEQHFTKPPARFTEASLVKTLEEKGIGRPSTYAPIIETIRARGYVEREEKALKPTNLGIVVTEVLVKHFPQILDIEFTAKMEEQLDEVEEGHADWLKLISEFYMDFERTVQLAEQTMQFVRVPPEATNFTCDQCGKPMVIKLGRYGKFYSCSGFPECKNLKSFGFTGVSCPQNGCNGELLRRKSRRGSFYGCSRYPECTFAARKLPSAAGTLS